MRKSTGDVVLTGVGRLRAPAGSPLSRSAWIGTPAKLGRMDRFCGLALVAVDEALDDAGLSAAEIAGERTAVAFGSELGCHAVNEEYYRGLLSSGVGGASPRAFAYTLPSSPLGEISIHYQTRGPASTVVSGVTAGLEALGAGVAEIVERRADRALIAAADVATPLAEELTSIAAEDGAAAFVLERADDAAARGGVPRARPRVVRLAHGGVGGRSVAVELAVRAALAAVERDTADVILAAPVDLPIVRGIGLSAAMAPDWPTGQRAAAAFFALIDVLAAERAGACLIVAADDENAAAAVIDID